MFELIYRYFHRVVLLVVLWLFFDGVAAAQTSGTLAYREVLKERGLSKVILDNGLSVVLSENHAAPVVAFQMWVRVGSRNEQDQEAGIAHVFEHMLFKGTEKRGVGEIARELEGAGGDVNAFTSFDHTVYHVVLASRYFDVGLDVIADAIQHSTFDPDELVREAEVVLEEFKRSEDMPSRVVGKKLFETAYTAHPYRRPIIGYEETFKNLTRQDILEFFHAWYAPNNMTLVVVGDFDTEAVLPKVSAAFERFEPNPALKAETPSEPPQDGVRAVVTRRESSHALLELGYHIPGIRDPRNPALDLLGILLGQGKTSRLYRSVKRERELVHTIGAYAYTPLDPGIFGIDASLNPAQIEAALREILREVQRLRVVPPSEEELQRAKQNVESGLIYAKQTMQGQARTLGYNESAFGDPLRETVYLKGITAVTPEEIRQMARRYLTPENLTVSLLLTPSERTDLTEPGLRLFLENTGREMEAAFAAATPEPDGRARKVILENGIRLIVKEDRAVPTVSVKIAFPGGQRYETEQTSGVFNFIAAMLDRGTARRNAEEIATEVEDLAGSLGGFSGRNSFGAELSILSRHFSKGMQLLADIVLHPGFDPTEMEKVRRDIVAAIRREDDRLSRRAGNLFRRTLYQTHPYRYRVSGEVAQVERFTPEALRETYFNAISPDRMVLAVVGDIQEQEVIAQVEALFGGMEKRPVKAPLVPREVPPEARREKVEIVERQQAHMVLGFLGTTVDSDDRHVLAVLSNVLSGMGGRLFTELRDKQSLAYTVTSFTQAGVDPGYFAVYIGCSPEKLDQARGGILAELARIREERIPEEELARTKRNLIGSFEIALQTNGALAGTLLFDELYRNDYDAYRRYAEEIEKVSAADVQRIARKYLDLSRYAAAVVRPEGAGAQ
jgi:zinc protease